MNYVVACLTHFNSEGTISRAADTVELLRRTFLKDPQLQDIITSTENVARENGQKANVSAIEITLIKH